ncbi:uncharacterized protein LOC126410068 [Nymphaea colorata]|nr:uncharacterized protein LOC126410068 [Nymphaea colorata]
MDERTSSTPLPKLTLSNYVSRAKTMEHFIRSKGLWGLVDGSKSEPQLVLTKTIDGKAQELDGVEKDKAMNEYERKWEEWKIGHHKIITWIIACVDTTTMGQIAKHNFAHEAWEFLKKTHTMKDVAYMCNLQMKIASLQQGDKSIKEYVGEMEQLWDELALFEPEWYDPRDIGVREKQIQREKFYKFILGLRSEYDGVKTSLLHRHKVPSMNEAIAELQMEENRLNFSKDKSESVLATSRPGAHMRTYRPPHFNRNYEHSNNGNKKIICFHCQEEGHTKLRCPKLRRFDKKTSVAGIMYEESNRFDLDKLVSALQPKLIDALQPLFKGGGTSPISGATVASTSSRPSFQEDDWGRF